MFSSAKVLLVSGLLFGVPLAAYAQPKADAGSGPTHGATSTNDAGSGPTPGAKPNTANSAGGTKDQGSMNEGEMAKPKPTAPGEKKIAP